MTSGKGRKVLAAFLLAGLLATCIPSVLFAQVADPTPLQAPTQPNPKYPDIIPIVMDVEDVEIANGNGMVLDKSGTVYTWGNNIFGTLGTGGKDSFGHPLTQVDLPGKATQIAAAQKICAALLEDGTVYDWGEDCSDYYRTQRYVPMKVPTVSNVHTIAANQNIFAIDDAGQLWSWGNTQQHLGRRTTGYLRTPEKIAISNVDTFLGTGNITFVSTKNGDIYGWGQNIVGSYLLGTSMTNIASRTNLKNTRKISSASALLAVNENHNLWVWGNNEYGQLGLGNTANVTGNNFVTSLEGEVVQAVTVTSASYILKTDGTVWATGTNARGRLGLGETDTEYVTTEFVQITGLENIKNIKPINSGGLLAEAENGDWWLWGYEPSSRHLFPDSEPYEFFDSPVLIFTASGTTTPDPDTYTITLTESWANAAQPDAVTTYTSAENTPLTMYFTTPQGYTAEVSSDKPITVDYEAGTIMVDSVTADMDILVTYTPVEEIDGHTVTLIVHYRDGAYPDDVTTYTVPDGAEFFEGYEVQPGYKYRSVSLYSFFYNVDSANQTVYISEVTQDITVEMHYERVAYNVTVSIRYEDGALEEDVQTYLVNAGEAFNTTFDILDGYEVVNVEANILGVTVDGWDKTINIRAVNGMVYLTITLAKE